MRIDKRDFNRSQHLVGERARRVTVTNLGPDVAQDVTVAERTLAKCCPTLLASSASVTYTGLAAPAPIASSENVDAPPGCAMRDGLLARIPAEPRTVFWQVRHPYDAVCSLRTGIAAGWGHHPRPPDWQQWQRRPLIQQCAHHWATINTFGYEQVADIAVVNRFEDMIRDPLTTAQRAASAVDIEPSQIPGALAAWAHRVRDKNDDRFVEARMSRHRSQPDHVRRVGRWRENLSAQEREQIRPIVAEVAANLGYSRDT